MLTFKFFFLKAEELLLKLAEVQAINRAQLFRNHLEPLLDLMEESSKSWTQHSEERFVFDTLLIEAGEVKLMQTVFIFCFKCVLFISFFYFDRLRFPTTGIEWEMALHTMFGDEECN